MAKKKIEPAEAVQPETKEPKAVLTSAHVKEMSPAWRLLYERIAVHARKK